MHGNAVTVNNVFIEARRWKVASPRGNAPLLPQPLTAKWWDEPQFELYFTILAQHAVSACDM